MIERRFYEKRDRCYDFYVDPKTGGVPGMIHLLVPVGTVHFTPEQQLVCQSRNYQIF